MSRRKKVTNITDQIVLLGKIETRVNAQGPTGPLFKMLEEKGIVLADDVALGVTALANNVSYLADKKESQTLLQQRDALMKPIISHTSDSLQFLKSLFSPNFKLVGDWGGTITDRGKITYATDTAGQVALLNAIKTKHESYLTPEVSPLAIFLAEQNIDLSNDSSKGATAILRDDAYSVAKKSSEDFREKRDKNWPNVVAHINAIGDFAMKLFKGNVKILGSYGYTVITDPKVVKQRIVVLYVGQTKLKIVVKINSTIFNSGTVAVNIYKGKTKSGDPILLAPGAIFLVTKGYSTVSAENTSQSVKAEITLIPA